MIMIRRMCLMLVVALAIVAVVPTKGARVVQRRGVSTPKKVARYSCPMHPEFVSSKPGKCPKCGMTLRLVKDEDTKREPPAAPPGVTTDAEVSARLHIPDVLVLD